MEKDLRDRFFTFRTVAKRTMVISTQSSAFINLDYDQIPRQVSARVAT